MVKILIDYQKNDDHNEYSMNCSVETGIGLYTIPEENLCSTFWNTPPEFVVQESTEDTCAQDYWSLGCIITELAFLTAPRLCDSDEVSSASK